MAVLYRDILWLFSSYYIYLDLKYYLLSGSVDDSYYKALCIFEINQYKSLWDIFEHRIILKIL